MNRVGNRRATTAFDSKSSHCLMLRTVEAVVENDGSLRLLEQVELRAGERALVTLLGEDDPAETALLSEPSLKADWDREEEDAAWAHLQ